MAPTINSYVLARHIPDAQLITYPDSGLSPVIRNDDAGVGSRH